MTFDDDRAVAGAGLALAATLSKQIGTFALANEIIDLGGRPGHALPGRKVLNLVHAMVAGAECIDDCDVLRSGSTGKVLGHGAMAPSTLGTFLRAFTFGHVRQLDRLSEELLTRAWSFGAAPGDAPMTIDIDSTIQRVYGKQKHGAAYGYTKVLGQHPLIATRADTGEALHIRHRKGSAGRRRGARRFVRETIGRVRRAGATGPLTLRADSGFHSEHVIKACRDHKVRYSITVNQNKAVVRVIEAIADEAWVGIDYTVGGEAAVAECPYGDKHRLVVRRTRLTGKQAELFPSWRYHALLTDRDGAAVFLDADHRHHAVVELAIRDLEEGAGMAHCPSGDLNANAAWVVLATIAHNMIRWLASLGLEHSGPVVAKTIRRKYITVPGRLTHRSRKIQLHLPTQWPWATEWAECFDRLRALTIQI
ncbi:MAG: IS1380 family transposase [Acidimicrobiales bacterium]